MSIDRTHAEWRCLANKESLTEWFGAGIACAWMGSKLVTKEFLDAKDYARLTKKAKEIIELIKKIRGVQ